jgi:hypothetical protein
LWEYMCMERNENERPQVDSDRRSQRLNVYTPPQYRPSDYERYLERFQSGVSPAFPVERQAQQAWYQARQDSR